MMRNVGANIKPKSVELAGMCINAVHHVCHAFESQTSTPKSTDHHPFRPLGKDFCTVLRALEEENVFVPLCLRQHPSFAHTHHGLMEIFTREELI